VGSAPIFAALVREKITGAEQSPDREAIEAVKRRIARSDRYGPEELVEPPDEHADDVWCEWEFEIPD
jgi:hypothetical protein